MEHEIPEDLLSLSLHLAMRTHPFDQIASGESPVVVMKKGDND